MASKKQISGGSLGISGTAVESWMERIKGLCNGYDQRDISNIDESGCFFKAFPCKGFSSEGKESQG